VAVKLSANSVSAECWPYKYCLRRFDHKSMYRCRSW